MGQEPAGGTQLGRLHPPGRPQRGVSGSGNIGRHCRHHEHQPTQNERFGTGEQAAQPLFGEADSGPGITVDLTVFDEPWPVSGWAGIGGHDGSIVAFRRSGGGYLIAACPPAPVRTPPGIERRLQRCQRSKDSRSTGGQKNSRVTSGAEWLPHHQRCGIAGGAQELPMTSCTGVVPGTSVVNSTTPGPASGGRAMSASNVPSSSASITSTTITASGPTNSMLIAVLGIIASRSEEHTSELQSRG